MPASRSSASSSKFTGTSTVELLGTVLKVVHGNPNASDGKTFYIFKFQPDPSCAANLKPEAILVPEKKQGGVTQHHIRVKLNSTLPITNRMRLTLRGFFQKDPKFGWQFNATMAEADTAKSKEEGILQALGSVKGTNGCPIIGRDRLKKLKQTFGAELPEILKHEPERLRSAIPALSSADVLALSEAWKGNAGLSDKQILLKLQEFAGIGTTLAHAILDEFGGKALATIRRDPYQLAKRVRGIGFDTADRIALDLKLAPQVRCLAWMEHSVRNAADEDGHCGVAKDTIVKSSAEFSGLEAALVEEILDGALKGKHSDIVEEGDILWLQSLRKAEETIAGWICESLKKPQHKLPKKIDSTGLSDEQSTALTAILAAPVSILTGGPGTGKTTLLRSIVQAAGDCVLCAPTGRAAKRLAEVTGYEAMTLHRLVLSKSNPVTRDCLLVVDESSMADVGIMAELAKKCAIKLPRLLFVGDADQLPSVGAGQFFRDLIASGQIPVHRLTKNFRSAGSGGGIISAAAKVLSGKIPRAAAFSPDADFCFIETETADEAAELAVEIATTTLPEQCDLNPLEDVQVLTPMRGGPAGTEELNAALRSRLNPTASSNTGGADSFAPGDRVINLQNQPSIDLFNGDLGVVTATHASKQEVTVRFDGREILLREKQVRWLKLAYAITTHKSQGSEYPAVVVALTKGHYILLDRNLLYTAMTRAQRHLVIVAQRGALFMAIKRAPKSRLTRLRSLLQEPADRQGGQITKSRA